MKNLQKSDTIEPKQSKHTVAKEQIPPDVLTKIAIRFLCGVDYIPSDLNITIPIHKEHIKLQLVIELPFLYAIGYPTEANPRYTKTPTKTLLYRPTWDN